MIAAPFTEGGSLAAYTAVAAGIVAAADEAVKSGRLKLGSSDAYDAEYKDFYQAWDVLYTATMVDDGLANAPQLVRSLSSIRIALSAKKLFSAAKSCGKEATVTALWEKGADKAVQLGKYSLASISKERGFIDLLPSLLEKENLTMDDFQYMLQKSVKALTKEEELKLERIRTSLPKPDANTLMQKVITKQDIEGYLKKDNPYITIRGFVTRASDAKHLKTYEDLYSGFRLDYVNNAGRLVNFVEDGSCGVIRFKSKSLNQITIPGKNFLENNRYPYTAHGFTSGNQGRLGVPEWHLGNGIDVIPEEGAEIWEVFTNGREVLRAIYEDGKFRAVKINE